MIGFQSLAVVLRVLQSLGSLAQEERDAVAEMMGFRRRKADAASVRQTQAPPASAKSASATGDETMAGPDGAVFSQSRLLPQGAFVHRGSRHGANGELRANEKVEVLAGGDALPISMDEVQSSWVEPPTDLLAERSVLASRLRTGLSASDRTRRPELRSLVRALSRWYPVRRIPMCTRLVWPRSVLVMVDRARRLAPLAEDQVAVLRSLERLGVRCEAVVVDDVGGVLSVGSGPRARGMSIADSASVVLALTDLGAFAGDDVRARWQHLARRLVGAGVTVCALVPWAVAGGYVKGAALWRMIAWEDVRHGRVREREAVRSWTCFDRWPWQVTCHMACCERFVDCLHLIGQM